MATSNTRGLNLFNYRDRELFPVPDFGAHTTLLTSNFSASTATPASHTTPRKAKYVRLPKPYSTNILSGRKRCFRST